MTLVMSLMAVTLLTALGSAMIATTLTETAIAASFRHASETFHAAEGAVAVAVQELAGISDWEAVLNGEETSRFVDGPADGNRTVGAVTLDLAQVTADVNTSAAGGSGGAVYRLYAYGRLADLVSAAGQPAIYVLVWVADLQGPGGQEEGGPPVLGLIARAYGPTGSRRAVAMRMFRTTGDVEATGALRIASWHELR